MKIVGGSLPSHCNPNLNNIFPYFLKLPKLIIFLQYYCILLYETHFIPSYLTIPHQTWLRCLVTDFVSGWLNMEYVVPSNAVGTENDLLVVLQWFDNRSRSWKRLYFLLFFSVRTRLYFRDFKRQCILRLWEEQKPCRCLLHYYLNRTILSDSASPKWTTRICLVCILFGPMNSSRSSPFTPPKKGKLNK